MSKRATDDKLGALHEVIASIYEADLKLMLESGEIDIQILKGAQAFCKENDITSSIADTPSLGGIQSSIIELDESCLPKGHDFKVVNG